MPNLPSPNQDAWTTADHDFIFSLMQEHAATLTGELMICHNLNRHGSVIWSGVSPDDFVPFAGTADSFLQLENLAIIWRDIPDCDPDLVVAVHASFSHHAFVAHVVAGDKARTDNVRAMLRQRGITTGARTASSEPLAANDNRPKIDPPPMASDPFNPESAGGILGEVAEWITRTAIIPVPELSIVSSIALLAGMFGRYALGPTKSGVNVYLTTLIPTAGGKGHPPKAIRSIADKIGQAGSVTNGDPTSYAAIERMLRKHASTVVTMDEFGITLQDVNAKHRNAVAASIRKFLLAVYDQANSSFDGRIYASSETKKDDGPIIGPALTVLGLTTAATLYAGLAEASVADGFINRFLFIAGSVAAGEIRPPSLNAETAPPAVLLERLKAAVSAFPKKPLPGNKTVIGFDGGESGAAYGRWAEVFLWQHHTAWSETERAINGRAAENTIRLATLRAISRNPAEPLVSVDDVEWGWAIVFNSIQIITDGVRRHMSSSPAEALRKSVLAVIEDKAGQPVPFSKLLERSGIRGAQLFEVELALEWLVTTGQIRDLAGREKPGKGSKFVRTA